MGKDYADMEIRTPGSAREIEAAASLFDDPLDARAVARFLSSDTHHLLTPIRARLRVRHLAPRQVRTPARRGLTRAWNGGDPWRGTLWSTVIGCAPRA